MSYPQIVDYNEAVQTPQHAFSDPILQQGQVRTSPLGLPLALSGGFALTYTVEANGRKFAVRCFHREVPSIEGKYMEISTALAQLSSSYFVAFDFQALGIQVRGRNYPIVKMDWVEGDTLGVFLDKKVTDKLAIADLRERFFDLSRYLEQKNIAHGDIQNENVIVVGGSLRLIDYDGMYVEGMRMGAGTEIGHKHFQHPLRSTQDFGPKIDRFSFIALDVSLAALEVDPSLHKKFREGGTTVLFKANDFADPNNAEIFRTLAGYPSLANLADRLANVCKARLEDTPSLVDFRAGRNIPGQSISRPVFTTSTTPRQVNYIGAFTVVDAARYADVLAQMGNRVELIGKIVSVHEGSGKRGRNKGKAYIFINFGNWLENSVKLTIWADGLQNFGAKPSQNWIGLWISATGLIDPPYTGKHYAKTYTNIGITIGDQSQIIQINEDEALFRLGQKHRIVQDRSPGLSTRLPQANPGTKPIDSNITILKNLGVKPTAVSTTGTVPSGSQGGASCSTSSGIRGSTSSVTANNAAILAVLNGSGPNAHPSPLPPKPMSGMGPALPNVLTTPSPKLAKKPSFLERVPSWLWVVVAITVLLIFGR